MIKLLSLLVALAAAGAATAQTSNCKLVRIADWQVRPGQDRPVVEGALNGQPAGILIDTAAERSLMRRAAVASLGLTIYEAEGGDAVQLEEFRIGSAARKDWSVPVSAEHDFGEDVSFVLGADFLRQVNIEFDLANRAVRLYQATGCDAVSLAYWTKEPGEVSIEAAGGTVLTVAVNGQPLRAQLDSAARSSVLSLGAAARLGATPRSDGAVPAGCVLGFGRKPVDSWIAPFASFAIGHELIRDPRIRIADLWRHDPAADEVSRLGRASSLPQMVLGADFLRAHRVLIARSQGRMYFTYAGGTVFPVAPSRGCNSPR